MVLLPLVVVTEMFVVSGAAWIAKSPRTSMSARELPLLSEKVAPFKKSAVPAVLPQTRFCPDQSTTSLEVWAAKPAKPVIGPARHWLSAVPAPTVRLNVPLDWKNEPPAQSWAKRR